MIISSKYGFVFVHIPKCAGTSVRTFLQEFDDLDGTYTGRVETHPELGLLDYVHIPLFVLREYFEKDFNKVMTYHSYAVIRDPFSRFASSVSQRLNAYGNRPMHKMNLMDVKREISYIIDFLMAQPRHNHLLPAGYIHFQKQHDYIYLNEERIVDKIYPVEKIGDLLGEVGHRVGRSFQTSEGNFSTLGNRSMVYRNNTVRSVIELTRPVTNLLSKTLPENTKNYLRSKVYVPRDIRMREIFTADYVRDFIRKYYAEDIRLIDGLKKGCQENIL